MRTLKPIYERDKYYSLVEEDIKRFLYYTIYKPILDVASQDLDRSFENSKGALIRAIKTGKIAFVEGYLVGEFNASIGLAIRQMGGNFNHSRKAYAIALVNLPLDVRSAINEGTKLLQQKVKGIYSTLEDLQKKDFSKSIDIEPIYSGIFIDLDQQFSSTIPRDLSIPIDTTPYMRESLRKNYTENLELEIKQWYDTAILRLRQKVYKNVEEGFRATHLIPIIQAEKQVSYNKAKFIAKQETSLLVSKYREARYTQAGLRRYKWLTSEDSRVRPDLEARKTGHTSNNHRILNGRIFSWDEPPIVDSATGRRCNPGEDYGCRCVAAPIVE